jgi:hypothetical protein
MYSLTNQQIDFIANDIRRRGIEIESLQDNLLDHICILIENHLKENGNFEACYQEVIRTFYSHSLKEIEAETLLLVSLRRPYLVLSRNQFFLLLFSFFIGPFIGYDLIWFLGPNHPAGTGIPIEIWGASMAYALWPLLVLVVLFLTPERLDPLIPKKSKIILGIRPFLKIIPPIADWAL